MRGSEPLRSLDRGRLADDGGGPTVLSNTRSGSETAAIPVLELSLWGGVIMVPSEKPVYHSLMRFVHEVGVPVVLRDPWGDTGWDGLMADAAARTLILGIELALVDPDNAARLAGACFDNRLSILGARIVFSEVLGEEYSGKKYSKAAV